MKPLPRIYLAHRYKEETRANAEANRYHAARVAAFVALRFKVCVVANWLWMTQILEESDANRKVGLEMDLTDLGSCEGCILAGAGADRSVGLRECRNHFVKHDGLIVDLTDWGNFDPFLDGLTRDGFDHVLSRFFERR